MGTEVTGGTRAETSAKAASGERPDWVATWMLSENHFSLQRLQRTLSSPAGSNSSCSWTFFFPCPVDRGREDLAGEGVEGEDIEKKEIK